MLARLSQAKRREDWRLGRWTAKTALAIGQELGDTPEILANVEVRTEPSGAPVLFRRGARAPYAMSLSHSDDVAMCVLADAGTLLGCDVERVEPRSQAFLAEYFTPEEQTHVPAGAGFERDARINVLWSAKESALKALGCGLRVDPLRLVVSLETAGFEDHWGRVTVGMGGASSFEGWWRISDGFAWTVVPFPASLEPLPL